MNKKIFILSSSPRKNGNSDRLAQEFAKGAKDNQNLVEYVNINDIDLQFCKGCLYCQSHDKCVIKDSMNNLYDNIQNSDVLVFATPIYYYQVSGQLKTFLDRLNPLYVRDNKFSKVYLLTASADDEDSATEGAKVAMQGWIDCFEGVELAGVVHAKGVTDKGDIDSNEALTKAYNLGKSI